MPVWGTSCPCLKPQHPAESDIQGCSKNSARERGRQPTDPPGALREFTLCRPQPLEALNLHLCVSSTRDGPDGETLPQSEGGYPGGFPGAFLDSGGNCVIVVCDLETTQKVSGNSWFSGDSSLVLVSWSF